MELIYIYGLVDPRTAEIRYVGASKDPFRRVDEHVRESRNGGTTAKCAWLREVLDANLYPLMKRLDRTTRKDWREVESHHIGLYSNLTNHGVETPEPEDYVAEEPGPEPGSSTQHWLEDLIKRITEIVSLMRESKALWREIGPLVIMLIQYIIKKWGRAAVPALWALLRSIR